MRQTSGGCRIAMWSGPRNISTAMMRAFENRSDTAVWDEPLYGPYLAATGLAHPMAKQVILEQGSDWRPIVSKIHGPIPDNRQVFYQKHMTHHLLPDIDRDWIMASGLTNCFLIRSPDAVLASYANKRGQDPVSASDLGFVQQAEIFDSITQATGQPPPVFDAVDILKNPEAMLRIVCQETSIEFSENMLKWPKGRRSSDGIWSEHWYDSVWQSTGFAPYVERQVTLPGELQAIADTCYPYFDKLAAFKRTVAAVQQ